MYEDNERCTPKLDNLEFRHISDGSREEIEKLFTEEEIFGCLMECNGDKVPGPDCFNMKFLQEFLGGFEG